MMTGSAFVSRYQGIIAVIDRARSDRPYVVATPPRVYRRVSRDEMEAVSLWEGRLVLELIEDGQFVVGSHRVDLRCGEYTRPVVTVGVSATTPRTRSE